MIIEKIELMLTKTEVIYTGLHTFTFGSDLVCCHYNLWSFRNCGYCIPVVNLYL